MRHRYQAIVQLIVCLFVACSSVHAEPSQVSVKGDVEFKLATNSQGTTVVQGGQIDGAAASIEGSGVSLKAKDGTVLASSRRTGEIIELLDPSGATSFSVATTPLGYEIFLSAGATLHYKIKFKREEFNLYGSDRLKVAGGALADGKFIVKDEAAKQILEIEGPGTLRELSGLAVPLPLPFRIVLWASKP